MAPASHPDRTSQGPLKPDPVQTSVDKFGISIVEVTPMRDVVRERKELGLLSSVKVLTLLQTYDVTLGNLLPLAEPQGPPLENGRVCGPLTAWLTVLRRPQCATLCVESS